MGCHIQVKDLALSYSWASRKKQIFRNLNLCIEVGSFVTVVGSNGCGKSSLIKLILGTVSPNRGEVHIAGKLVQPGYPQAVRNHHIAYLAQQIEDLFFADKVSEELTYDHALSNMEREETLSLLGLEKFLNRSIDSLSGGERQGLALAQFMILSAPLLILDEPSSYLDHERATLLKNYLVQAQGRGKTIIHVTQFPDEIEWGTHVLDLDQADPKVILV